MKKTAKLKAAIKAALLENGGNVINVDYALKQLKEKGIYEFFGTAPKPGAAFEKVYIMLSGETVIKLNKKQAVAQECREAIKDLKEMLKPGETIYTMLNHVSASGMMRHISLKIVRDNKICDITYPAALALDDTRAKNGGIKCGGCGMDMGFNLVYNLGRVLNPESVTDGGYTYKQSWL